MKITQNQSYIGIIEYRLMFEKLKQSIYLVNLYKDRINHQYDYDEYLYEFDEDMNPWKNNNKCFVK